MSIAVKLTSLVAAIFLMIGLVGLFAVNHLQGLAQESAAAEAKNVAQTIASLISRFAPGGDAPANSRDHILDRHQAELQQRLDDIFSIHRQDMEILDANKKIIADLDYEDVGKILENDPDDTVAKTIRDGVLRTYVEIDPNHIQPRKQVVVPIKIPNQGIVGALILEYTPLYDELASLTRKPVYAVVGMTTAGWILATGIGILFFWTVSRPIRRLQEAAVDVASGKRGVIVAVSSRDEIGQLTGAFNAMTQSLQERDSALRRAQTVAKLGHVITGPDGSFESWSETMPQLLGMNEAEMPSTTRDWLTIVHPDDRTMFRDHAIEAGKKGKQVELEYRLHRADGVWIYLHQVMESLPGPPDASGQMRWFNTIQDVTEQKQAEIRIKRLNRVYAVLSGINSLIVRAQEQNELFKEACRIAVDAGAFRMAWIGIVDAETLDGKVVAWYGGDPGFVDMIRLTARSGTPDSERPASVSVREKRVVVCNDVATEPALAPLRGELLARGHHSVAAFPLIVGDRAVAVFALFAGEAGFFDEEELTLLTELASNISFALDHLGKVEKLDYLAYFDALTGLANRILLQDRLRQAIANATRRGDMVTVAYLDLDLFKNVNDSLGHSAGDELLKTVATRLQASVRESDTVARLGGDEFVLLLNQSHAESAAPEADIPDVMQRLMGNVSKSVVLAGVKVSVSCSIGLSVYPQDGQDPEILLRNADAAMYRAKELGRNNFQFFTADMHDRIKKRIDLESGLKRALERNEFELHYQPQVDLQSGKILGAEALLRWRHPQEGLIAPGQFISLAEESGLIIPIGEWVLARACAQNKAWQDAGLPPIPVAVNLSARQCAQENIDTVVRGALQATKLAARYLELELTESISMANPEKMVPLMQRLKDMGVGLSIDDFGTGYSSMSCLKRFPVDKLKLDLSFVREITTDPANLAISQAIITLAHSLNLLVVAEGVETEGQLALLAARGCDQVQGYYFSRPVPAHELAQLLRDDRRLDLEPLGREGKSPALLVVDDDPDAIALIQSILLPEGYHLLLTSCVAEAFELLARHEVGVVLCDQLMPEMSGVEFLSKVRSMYPDAMRVLMSAYDMRISKLRAKPLIAGPSTSLWANRGRRGS